VSAPSGAALRGHEREGEQAERARRKKGDEETSYKDNSWKNFRRLGASTGNVWMTRVTDSAAPKRQLFASRGRRIDVARVARTPGTYARERRVDRTRLAAEANNT